MVTGNIKIAKIKNPFFYFKKKCIYKLRKSANIIHTNSDWTLPFVLYISCSLIIIFSNSEDAGSPTFWARVCLHNMAKLAKEATTVRRVLESLFRYFDNNNLWAPEHGLARSVLVDMQDIMENSGNCLLFSYLHAHLVLPNSFLLLFCKYFSIRFLRYLSILCNIIYRSEHTLLVVYLN